MASTRVNGKRLAGLVLRWYASHGRTLPWRNTRNPYRILISETMLQQTQVQRVLTRYPEFLRRFPTVRSLANAPLRDVVIIWRGMGYNNRAVRLHRLARQIMTHHGGRVPDDEETLRSLPGIGKYTAAAIRSSAFRAPVPAVDINVRRVLSRLFTRMCSVSSLRPEAEVGPIAHALLPRRYAYEWNQALMDLGATVCTARTPRCADCPVSDWCRSMNGMTLPSVRMVQREPSRAGIPNRIYRGRIIEVLRHVKDRGGITAAAIGCAVYPRFSRRDSAWLDMLLASLHRDGLISIRRHSRRIALR